MNVQDQDKDREEPTPKFQGVWEDMGSKVQSSVSKVQESMAEADRSFSRSLESFVTLAGYGSWLVGQLERQSEVLGGRLSAEANAKIMKLRTGWNDTNRARLQAAGRDIVALEKSLSKGASQPFSGSHWTVETATVYDAIPDEMLKVGTLTYVDGERRAVAGQSGLPMLVPHLAFRNLSITADPGGSATGIEAMHIILLRMLATTPNLTVHMIDGHHNGVHFSKFSPGISPLIPPAAVTENSIRDRLQTLAATIADVSSMKLRGKHADIIAYNAAAKSEGLLPEPHRLLVAMNPKQLSRTNYELLAKIERTGLATGVHVLSVDLDRGEAHPLGDIHVQQTGETFAFLADQYQPVTLDASPDTSLVHSVVEGLADAHRERVKNQKIDLENVLQSVPRWSRTPQESISTPVGMVGERLLELGLYVKGGDVHSLVVGQTGSGKSSLLHAIIMGYAHCYSPDDVQFLLVDGKGGVEMRDYAAPKDNPAAGLPHARVVAIESDVEMYMSVLDYLMGEMSRRNAEFKRNGVTNIVELKSKGTHFPRYVAVLDEFHVLLQDPRYKAQCVERLTAIAKQGRSVGIHLVLSTQSLAGLGARGENKALFDNLALKIAFRCDDSTSEDILGPGDLRAARISSSGAAYVKRSMGLDAGDAQLVQVGFESAEDRLRRINDLSRQGTSAAVVGVLTEDRFVFGTSDGEAVTTCSELLQHPGTTATYPLRFWLGSPTTIGRPSPFLLRRRAGGNVVLLGGDPEIASRLAAAAVLGLSGRSMTVDVIGSQESAAINDPASLLVNALQSAGLSARLWSGDVEPLMTGLMATPADGDREQRLLVVMDLNEIGAGSPLGHILKTGPQQGIHSIVWARTMADLLARVLAAPPLIASKVLPYFDVRVEFDLSVQDKDALGMPKHPLPDFGKAVVWTTERMGITSTVIPFAQPEAAAMSGLLAKRLEAS